MSYSRLGLRFSTAFRSAFRRQPLIGRRSAQTAAEGKPVETGFNFGEWARGPTGVKTVHFWAPVMKWALVLAGVSDFARPAESLSMSQNLALTATGAIWTRWCLIIKPRNILLAAVNFFLGIVGATQVTRILMYRRSLEESPIETAAESVAESVADTVSDAVAKVKK